LRLSKNLIIAIVSLLAVTVISVTVVMVIYFNSYIVTYDLDGGVMEETETRVWVGSEYSLPSPTKNGYAFAGWYLDGKYFMAEGIWELERDVKLTAKWGLRDSGGVIFDKNDKGYIIESYSGDVSSNVVLPLKFNGEPVVEVKSVVFDLLKSRVKESSVGFIKVYVPSTAKIEYKPTENEGLILSKYTALDPAGFVYLENENSVTLTGYTGKYEESIVIPMEYNGKTVDGIGDYALYGTAKYSKIETSDFFRILMPECIKTVGKKAFSLCNGIKVSVYYEKDGKTRELVSPFALSRLYDWIVNAKISDGNDELIKVITQILPAFGWTEHTAANYYVRFNANGGEIVKKVPVENNDGETVYVTVNVKDITDLKKNKKYELPVPTREGYTFDGWYYGETLVPQTGDKWGFDTHIELDAKWTEIQKEG